MVKAYLRYVLKETFGVIASPHCNAVFVDPQCRLAAAGCLENVTVWNLKQSLQVRTGKCAYVYCSSHAQLSAFRNLRVHFFRAQVNAMKGESASATCLVASPDRKHLAAGYRALCIFTRGDNWTVLTLMTLSDSSLCAATKMAPSRCGRLPPVPWY